MRYRNGRPIIGKLILNRKRWHMRRRRVRVQLNIEYKDSLNFPPYIHNINPIQWNYLSIFLDEQNTNWWIKLGCIEQSYNCFLPWPSLWNCFMPETQSVVCIILLFYFKIVVSLNNHISEVPGVEVRGREAALV